MQYIYILQSEKTGDIYKGMTNDLRRRFKEHNAGQETSTKNGAPWKLLYYEAFQNKTDARREEIFLKSGKGRERLKYLLQKTLEPR